MQIVYRLIFNNRKLNNDLPYMYIGSKSNSQIIDGKIIAKNGKEYWGSSKSSLFFSAFAIEQPIVEILYSDNKLTPKELNIKEKDYQLKYKVDISVEYFNMFISPINNFIWSDYATYKHINYPNIYKRLPRNHYLVKNKTFVGTTYGLKMPQCGRICKGKENPFYGKTHTPESKLKMSVSQSGKTHTPESKLKMSVSRKGKKKSEQHKENIRKAHNNKCTIKKGKERKLISVNDLDKWKELGWVGILHGIKLSRIICPHCKRDCAIGTNYNRWHKNKSCLDRLNRKTK